MNNKQHLSAVANILENLENVSLSPQDKVAALKTAAATLENGLTAEMTFQVYKNCLTNQNT